MRYLAILAVSLMLAACDAPPEGVHGPVDADHLPPMSSKEQALVFGADGAMQQGNSEAAERDYLTAAGISSGHIEAHIALARLYDKQKEFDKEREILNRALELQPNNALANYMLGKIDLNDNQYNDAIAHFDRGLKQHPGDLDLNTGKAVASDMLGNHKAAQALYNQAMHMNPDANLATLRTNLAMSYLLDEQPKKAVEILQPEVRKGTSIVARDNLALAYGTLGRNADARKLLNGEMDEETRLLTVARLREYWKSRDNDMNAAPLQPNIMDATEDTKPVKKPKAKPVGLPANSPLAKAIKADVAAKKAAPAPAPVMDSVPE